MTYYTFRNIKNDHFDLHTVFRLDNVFTRLWIYVFFKTKIQDGGRRHVEFH